MPVGIQRLNARRSQPNPQIVFIKPLKGPDEEAARDFLERIAAQCVPIMREHHLSVVTLEEYEPNASFVGRNFNAGEVVQLVLKARFSGRWLPFSYVQMVMMHELAHCRHMHHARAFWAVRDTYAARMRSLWAQNYTGEGVWGRGARLGTADALAHLFSEQNTARPGGGGDGGSDGDGVLLEHLCGGTFRSRGGRHAKRKPALTYREQQERRVRRRFGEHGVSLGGDVAERAKLEGGGVGGSRGDISISSQKRVAVKPRVAKSKRGRDLRAAAALARFEQQTKGKKEEDDDQKDTKDPENQQGAITSIKREADADSSDDDDNDDDSPTVPDAIDIDGTRMVDGQGRGMVRVCEAGGPEDDDDEADSKRELRELLQESAWGSETKIRVQPRKMSPDTSSGLRLKREPKEEPDGRQQQQYLPMPKREPVVKLEAKHENDELQYFPMPKKEPVVKLEAKHESDELRYFPMPKREPVVKPEAKHESNELSLMDIPLAPTASVPASTPDPACPVCSMANRPLAVTCAMCAHVLLPDADAAAWQCRSAACSSGASIYTNAGDCGICGACGQRRG